MQSLLRWSIENSATQGTSNTSGDHQPSAQPQKLDPGIIDALLGRPDSELMKEDVAAASDTNRSEDERVEALDHLEMLIEQIDNANDLGKLNLWEPLHKLLVSDEPTSQIKMHVLWIIGTATQNNPSAQDAYLALNPLPVITAFLTPSPSSTLKTRSKAIYALSGLLKHNSTAVRELSSPNVEGWSRLRDALQDPDIAVRRKTIFLLGTLLIPTTPSATTAPPQPGLHTPSTAPPAAPIHANSHAVHLKDPSRTNTSEPSLVAFREHGLLEAVISALTNPFPYGEDGDIQEPDPTFEEQGVRLLHIYVVLAKGQILDSEKETLRKFIAAEQKKDGEKALAERWNLGLQELQELVTNL